MQEITAGVRVATSQLWQTNTGIVDGPHGALLIDAGIFEPEFLAIAAAAGPIAAGFATHAHWDHILWHRQLGESTPRYATSETIARIQHDRDRILSNLTSTEAHIHEIGESDGSELWDRAQLFKEQPIAWGFGEIAGIPVEIMHIPGHEHGQAALILPRHRVAFVADTLSDVETPSVHDGRESVALYLQTLDRLQEIIDRCEWIIPGHGTPANRAEAQRRLDLDRVYLTSLWRMVNSARAEEGTEELARRILAEIGETRAESELAWSMHLDNIRQLMDERDASNADLPTRRSSRIILMNDDNRIWMLRIDDSARPRWILPGGGVEAGEEWINAAARELWEECGIENVEIGPMVATRERVHNSKGKSYYSQERHFLVHAGSLEPQNTNMTEHERNHYSRGQWLSADEIRQSNEVVYPLGIADLIDEIAAGRVPEIPREWEN